MLELKNLQTWTSKTTSVMSIPVSVRDALLDCRGAYSIEDDVYIESEYVIDIITSAELDAEIISLLKELVLMFARTETFLFCP